MHRRYNRWHSRFDQPDPYDGSYDMTNPQSFNRYSYVMNDPVNFVDPLGLDSDFGLGPPPPVPTYVPPMPTGPLDTAVINTSAPYWSAGGVAQAFSGGDVFFELEHGPGETGGGGGPNVGSDPQPQDTPTSCQRFAETVDEINTNHPHLIAEDLCMQCEFC